jgi:hypothetical protein
MKRIQQLAAMAVMALAGVSGSLAQDCGCPPLANRTPVYLKNVVDANGNLPAGTTTWTCNNVYYLDSKVYVLDGSVLNIQAGTIIKGVKTNTAVNANALIVTRGAKINAVGTPSCPIIFTAQTDNCDGTFPLDSTERWGGVILLGKAHNNMLLVDNLTPDLVPSFAEGGGDGICSIEGLSTPDARHWYGATSWTNPATRTGAIFEDNDNSGVLQYVSIRHGGAELGTANEINGLTMGSVGRGTIIDHVEVISNEDDGFEFFGGTVNVKYCASMFCKDDGFDWDQGYSGFGQFLYVLQLPCFFNSPEYTTSVYGSGLELDGQDVSNRTPLSDAKLFNVTVIGNNTANSAGMEPKAQTNGEVSNSLFFNFPTGVKMNTNVVPFYTPGGPWITKNNTFDAVPVCISQASEAAEFTADGNLCSPQSTGIDYTLESTGCTVTGKVDAIPDDVAATRTTYNPPVNGFFVPVTYRGAFAPGSDSWLNEWSLLDKKELEFSTIYCPTDVTGDGKTDGSDFLDVLGNIFTNCQ